MNTGMTHRRLRPWVVHTLEATAGAIIAVTALVMYMYVLEAVTGFNPLWLFGVM